MDVFQSQKCPGLKVLRVCYYGNNHVLCMKNLPAYEKAGIQIFCPSKLGTSTNVGMSYCCTTQYFQICTVQVRSFSSTSSYSIFKKIHHPPQQPFLSFNDNDEMRRIKTSDSNLLSLVTIRNWTLEKYRTVVEQ